MKNQKENSQVDNNSFSFEKNKDIIDFLFNGKFDYSSLFFFLILFLETKKKTTFPNLNNLSSNEINDKKPPVIAIKKFFDFSRTNVNDIDENEKKLESELSPNNNKKEAQTKKEKIKKKKTIGKKINKDITEENLISEISPVSNRKKETISTINMTKLYKLISQFYVVKKFIILLLDSTIYRRARKLTKKHYDIISDEIFYFDNNKNVTSEEELTSNKKNASAFFIMMNKEIPCFHPNRFAF